MNKSGYIALAMAVMLISLWFCGAPSQEKDLFDKKANYYKPLSDHEPSSKKQESDASRSPQPANSFLTTSELDHASTWVRDYGALSVTDHPDDVAPQVLSMVRDVFEVFKRVLAAADKRANRFPKLLILREADEPWAICLRDGTVLLTQKAMEFCYQGTDKTTGDARMAFLLGHELAHLANDDYWHLVAFEALANYGNDQKEKAIQKILEQLQKNLDAGNTTESKKVIRKKELKADANGLLYATMAGYDPTAIVNKEGRNFFQEWVNQITGEIAFGDELHPTPELRATFLLSNMKAVCDELDLFNLGVRLYQLGRYDDSLEFMVAFNEKFPSREVFNNIGLIHYQKALEALAQCDWNKAYQYKLSATVAIKTRAETFNMESLRGDLCSKMAVFKKENRKAMRYFNVACEKDPYYIPSRVNLSSALIMAGRYNGATDILDEALNINENDPAALNNRALALYLHGPSIDVDMHEQSTNILEDIIEKNPRFSDAYYNLGVFEAERGRNASAKKHWEKYLQLESTGVYAEMIRKNMNPETTEPVYKPFYEAPPVKLGRFDETTKEQLRGLSSHPLNLGNISGTFYSGNGLLILVLKDVAELVVSPVEQKISFSDMIEQYSSPCRIYNNPAGIKTLMYEKFAVDIQDGMITKVVHFDYSIISK